MAISTYDELQAAIASWMDRSDITASIPDIISMGEAGLNRELEGVAADATLTGTVGSRAIDISALSLRTPIALFITDGTNEYELRNMPDGSFPYSTAQADPQIWAIDGSNINFDCLLDSAYSFRFRYTAQFALSDANPTNWLLTTHPDLYLAACIAWGGKFVADDAAVQRYGGMIESMIASINRQESRKKRGKLSVDPALSTIRRGHYQW